MQALPAFYPADLRAYGADPFIAAAVELQSLDHATALRQLHAMASEEHTPARVVVLCQMLFMPRPGAKFRRPGLGAAEYFGGTSSADWPNDPIEIVDGVPFLIVWGYTIAGMWATADSYVHYYEENGNWTPFRHQLTSAERKRSALRKLLASAKWKTDVDRAERESFFRRQIE